MMLRQTLTGRVQKGDWKRRICDSLANVRLVLTSHDSRDGFDDQHIGALQGILQSHLDDVVSGALQTLEAQSVCAKVDAWPCNMFPKYEIGVRHHRV